LWKNRDTDFLANSVQYFKGARYDFIAIVNAVETNPTEVWMGTNAAGFAIMNTQSYNLVAVEEGEERGAANGRILRRALEVCATVDDFRHFLDTIGKPSYIEANIGVIDAQGGAAMFEVAYDHYTFYDANNPSVAPYGYIVRTNFSFAGTVNDGAGYVRFMTAEQKFMQASATGDITPQWIFNQCSRSFENAMLDIDLRSGDYNRPKGSGWFVDQDFIPRGSTGSSVVVQGVRKGENPELTTMWTALGYPPVSVGLPVWLKGADKHLSPLLVRDDKRDAAPLGDCIMTLRDRVFSYKQGMGTDKYFRWELLWTPSGDGYMQQLAPTEERIFDEARAVLERMRGGESLSGEELQRFTDRQAAALVERYGQISR
jgi:hypothetical protein